MKISEPYDFTPEKSGSRKPGISDTRAGIAAGSPTASNRAS